MVYVVGVVVVLAVIGSLSSAIASPPAGASYSNGQVVFLVLSGCGALIAAGMLGANLHGAWWLLPLVGWAFGVVVVKILAAGDRDRGLAEQRRVAEAERQRAEAQRQRAELQVQRDRAQRERLGKGGVELLSRARRTVKRIAATEAAREGWLGSADGL